MFKRRTLNPVNRWGTSKTALTRPHPLTSYTFNALFTQGLGDNFPSIQQPERGPVYSTCLLIPIFVYSGCRDCINRFRNIFLFTYTKENKLVSDDGLLDKRLLRYSN